jgi:hypothetical protein
MYSDSYTVISDKATVVGEWLRDHTFREEYHDTADHVLLDVSEHLLRLLANRFIEATTAKHKDVSPNTDTAASATNSTAFPGTQAIAWPDALAQAQRDCNYLSNVHKGLHLKNNVLRCLQIILQSDAETLSVDAFDQLVAELGNRDQQWLMRIAQLIRDHADQTTRQ